MAASPEYLAKRDAMLEAREAKQAARKKAEWQARRARRFYPEAYHVVSDPLDNEDPFRVETPAE